jgi:hypothetical protein
MGQQYRSHSAALFLVAITSAVGYDTYEVSVKLKVEVEVSGR